MEALPPIEGWSNLAEGLLVVLLGLISGIGGLLGFRRMNEKEDPAAVAATLIDTRQVDRLTQSFESLARVIEIANKLREDANKIRAENSAVIKENNRMLEKIADISEDNARHIRDLTHEVRRNVEK